MAKEAAYLIARKGKRGNNWLGLVICSRAQFHDLLKIPTLACPTLDWVLAFHTWSCMAFHILTKAEQLYFYLFMCFLKKIPL
jgi:hypothetical protein